MIAQTKKVLSYLLKLAILALAFWFIYRRIITDSDNLKNFQSRTARIDHNKVLITMILVVLLMLINWLLESLKWWHLTRVLAPMSLWRAIESVFCGLTWAIVTPYRLGEYGGRVMFLPNRKRIHGVFIMAVGGLGQNVITNVLGAGASVWFLYTFMHVNRWLMLGITIIALIFMVLMIILYFNIKRVVSLLNRVRFLKKFHRFFDIMGKYNTAELLHIMWFCLARFFVFTFQYYLIFHLLIPELRFVQVTLLMFVFFFIQSAIPSLDLLDIGVRALTASTLFAYITHQSIAIIVGASLIYIINLVIPAILGSVFVFKLNFFDRTA